MLVTPSGVRSSRAIARKCVDDVAFRFLAADQGAPDFRSIARFRRRHLDALAGLFRQSLHLAQRLGMVKMGRVALDGTKLEASASKDKAMSYGRLIGKEEQIEAEIAALEATARSLLDDAESPYLWRGSRFAVAPQLRVRNGARPSHKAITMATTCEPASDAACRRAGPQSRPRSVRRQSRPRMQRAGSRVPGAVGPQFATAKCRAPCSTHA